MLVRKMMIRLVRIYRMMRRRKKILVMHYQFYTLLSNEMDEDGFIVVEMGLLCAVSSPHTQVRPQIQMQAQIQIQLIKMMMMIQEMGL